MTRPSKLERAAMRQATNTTDLLIGRLVDASETIEQTKIDLRPYEVERYRCMRALNKLGMTYYAIAKLAACSDTHVRNVCLATDDPNAPNAPDAVPELAGYTLEQLLLEDHLPPGGASLLATLKTLDQTYY